MREACVGGGAASGGGVDWGVVGFVAAGIIIIIVAVIIVIMIGRVVGVGSIQCRVRRHFTLVIVGRDILSVQQIIFAVHSRCRTRFERLFLRSRKSPFRPVTTTTIMSTVITPARGRVILLGNQWRHTLLAGHRTSGFLLQASPQQSGFAQGTASAPRSALLLQSNRHGSSG